MPIPPEDSFAADVAPNPPDPLEAPIFGDLRIRAQLGNISEVTPKAALDLQLEYYRAMKPGERVATALRLHELACEMARLGIRRQHPHLGEVEVNRLLRRRAGDG